MQNSQAQCQQMSAQIAQVRLKPQQQCFGPAAAARQQHALVARTSPPRIEPRQPAEQAEVGRSSVSRRDGG